MSKKTYRWMLAVTLVAGCTLDSRAQGALDAAQQGPVLQAAQPAQAEQDAERARIAAERTRVEAAATDASADCYQKFFVNSCLDEIKTRRMAALNSLRNQQIALDENDRRAKAADQLSAIEAKSSPQRQREDAEKRQAALREFESRSQRAAQKEGDRAAAKAQEGQRLESSVKRMESSRAKSDERAQKQAAAADAAKKYKDRQDKALERRARFEQEQANRKSVSRPLPVRE
ncbi:MAG: hypothetical protein JWP47_656 [Polaromonas sp.]|nr:hypothetical protein [Polaromonas sp.]